MKNKIIVCFVLILFIVIIFLIVRNSNEKENSIFSIERIIAYSSAEIINNSKIDSLTNLNVDQFTDISLYINNHKGSSPLSDSNTIKEMYIDNISITSKSNIGFQKLNYKSPMFLGKYQDLMDLDDNRINFEIINTNQQNEENNYLSPVFYTDCSNPITIGYINKNILNNYSISNNKNMVSYNAKVLKEANINLEDISNSIKFTIHIVNNNNRNFSCDIDIDLDFFEDFLNDGYSYFENNLPEGEYRFLREK